MLPKITSVTMTANLNCVLNLKEIALKTNNCVYNKTHYDRLLIKLRKPAVTVAIHSSGKLVLTGSKTRADGKTGLRRIGRLIQNLGFNVEMVVVHLPETHLPENSLARKLTCPKTHLPENSFARNLTFPNAHLPENLNMRFILCFRIKSSLS